MSASHLILLQKSAIPVAWARRRLSERTMDAPMGPTRAMRADIEHPLRNARVVGGGRANEFCKAAKALRDGGECELILCTARAAQSTSAKSQNALVMGEQHLDPLAIAARLLKRRSADKGPGDIAGILMDTTWDFALRRPQFATRAR
jgi:hypothetical protein